MDPTETGVWWRNDNQQWERYSPADTHKIMEAWRNGETKLTLGPFKSSGRRPAPLYSIDLVSMKQTNTNSGLSRDIKIIPVPEDNREGGSGEDIHGEILPVGQVARPSKNEIEKNKSVVTITPSVTIDLRKLNSQCGVEDQCNLVLKLPKAVVQTDARLTSMRNQTLSLLLEKLSSQKFIENLLMEKWPDWLTRVDRFNPYRLGQAEQSARYGSFLNHLCALAEEEEGVVERLFRVAEQGYTAEGDPVEYLFTIVDDLVPYHILEGGVLPAGCGLLNRTPPAKKQMRKETWVIVCLGISKFLKDQRRTPRTPGAVIPVALVADRSCQVELLGRRYGTLISIVNTCVFLMLQPQNIRYDRNNFEAK